MGNVPHRVWTEQLCDSVLGAGLVAVDDGGVPQHGPVVGQGEDNIPQPRHHLPLPVLDNAEVRGEPAPFILRSTSLIDPDKAIVTQNNARPKWQCVKMSFSPLD